MKQFFIVLSLLISTSTHADTTPFDQELSVPAVDENGVKFFVPAHCAKISSCDNCLTRSALELLESRIDILLDNACCACAPTPIHDADFEQNEYSITAPGVYCLAEDVIGAIFIESDNVILDLNGHAIFRIGVAGVVVSGQSNVQIKNGLISLPPQFALAPLSSSGILIDNQSDTVRIENMTITRLASAIILDAVFDITINTTLCTNNSNGLTIQNGCQDIDVRHSQFDGNNLNGVIIDTSSAVRLQECGASHNGNDGFLSVTSDCIQFIQCVADANFNDGFELLGIPFTPRGVKTKALALHGSGIVITDCSACFNVNDGFECVHDSNINIYNCFANGNLKGFEFEDNCLGIIRACTATNNSVSPRSKSKEPQRVEVGVGFADDGTNGMEYYSNYACDNQINYSTKITSASIAGPSFADGVDNIDCALEDTIECDSSSSSSERDPSACAPRPIYLDDFIDTCPLLSGGGGGAAPLIKGCTTHFTGCLLITESGTYCLAEDVSGSITITASSVTLDMNGYTVYGLPGLNGINITNPSTTQPLIDVRVKNGLLSGVGGTNGGYASNMRNRTRYSIGVTSTGIVVDGANGVVEDVRIENVTISNWDTGIVAQGFDATQFMSQLLIKNVMTRDNAAIGIGLDFCDEVMIQASSSVSNDTGLRIIDTQNVSVEQSSFDFNRTHGVNFDSDALVVPSLNYDFNKCQANSNQSVGFFLQGDSVLSGMKFVQCTADFNNEDGFGFGACSCIEFNGCSATGNSVGYSLATQFGDLINASHDILFKDCIACANNNNQVLGTGHFGFSIDSSFGVCLENCVAKGHTASSFIGSGAGFIISDSRSFGGINIVRGCTASDNETGFSDITGTSKYYSNVACGNMTNYLGVVDAPITSAAAAQAFENVDCLLTGPGPAALTLSIAEAISDIVIDIDADTDATLSIVEHLSSAVDHLVCPCFDLINRVHSIVEDISIVTDTTNSLAEHIVDTQEVIIEVATQESSLLDVLESSVEHLSSLVENLAAVEPGPCAAIIITAPTTINVPGNYCLANDITVTSVNRLQIFASNVTLDLNGHKITVNLNSQGIRLEDGSNNIVMKNGFLIGTTTTSIGILIGVAAGNQDILIEGITIQNCRIGIDAFLTTDLAINNVIVSNPTTSLLGMRLDTITNAHVKNCQVEGSEQVVGSDNGIAIISSSNIQLENCASNNCNFVGTLIVTSNCIEVIDCSAEGNGSSGFECDGSTDVLFKNCYACNNDTVPGGFAGFNIESTNTDVYLLNCVAENNNNVDGYGFFIDTASGTLVQGCTATNNDTGFQDSGNNANRFYSNIACNNGTNFNPTGVNLTAAVAASSAVAGAFENIACN